MKQLAEAVHGGDALALLPLRDQLEELGFPPAAADLFAGSCDPKAPPAGIRGGDPWRPGHRPLHVLADRRPQGLQLP